MMNENILRRIQGIQERLGVNPHSNIIGQPMLPIDYMQNDVVGEVE